MYTREIPGTKICRLKVVVLAGFGLHTFTWLVIISMIGSYSYWKLGGTTRTKNPYPDYFDTYVNYTGPQPIPGPINLSTTLQFVLNEPDACGVERHPGMRVLHYVHSAPEHFQQREFIRNTWASSKFYAHYRMVTIFFLGRTGKDSVQELIEQESARFHDVIQADILDSYYNLTYKAVSALAWVSQFCGRAEYVVKTDDDVFVNIFRLMEVLFLNGTMKDAIHCSVYSNGSPHRNPRSKWFIPQYEFPWRKYPNFCAGMAMYYSGHLIPKLYAATLDVPYLKLDDVYVSGLLRHRAGIGINDLGSAVNIRSEKTCLQEGHKSEVFCHVQSAMLKKDLWWQLLLMEITKRANKSEADKLDYMEALADISK